ncbi:AbrB family transcriptional regulator [Patulibacter sp.]|uniref:AbrB family transcriptional regulator n=1 Tax=Patulibacter sp. TaxID=1912859 RepID=UPI00271D8614|nr:AbrB family transcriptional regulator [Patulibacter sp.]MDO9410365.1 AbrB family transcriptional regulator [Patulibacter sp.]
MPDSTLVLEPHPPGPRARRWVAVGAATTAGALAAAAVGVPSPALFAGLLIGLAFALRTDWGLDVPGPGARVAQGVLGVSLGVLVQSSTLTEIGRNAAPILGVTLATLIATVVAGLLMSRLTGLDRPTASFGMVAGGASGIVAISRDLGADERLVAVMQYLRVLVIVVLTPVVVGIAGGGGGGRAAPAGAVAGGWVEGTVALALCLAVGLGVARIVRLPAGSLLGPLIVAAGLSLAGADLMAPVPPLLLQIAYVAIGLSVGLRFTVSSLRHAARILPATLGLIAALILVSAGLGLLLVPLAGVGALDAYLATTPGGLYVVLASASTSDVDATFVLAVQVLRLFAMLLAAPLLARWLVRREQEHPA